MGGREGWMGFLTYLNNAVVIYFYMLKCPIYAANKCMMCLMEKSIKVVEKNLM